MSIKGYLNEIKFVELLRLIAKSEGRLGIWNFGESKQYECFIQNNQILYLNFSGKDVTDLDEAKSLFAELLSDNNSYFAFNNDRVSNFPRQPLISLSELLEFTLSRSVSKMDSNDELPNLQTRFETVSKSFTPVEGELEEFWKNCVWMLHEGCSGDDICNKFTYSPREVQENLYRLRVKGLIKPVRVFKPINAGFKKSLITQNLRKIANKNSVVAAGVVEDKTLQINVDSFEQAKKINHISSETPVQAETANVSVVESTVPAFTLEESQENTTTYAAPIPPAYTEAIPPTPLLLHKDVLASEQINPFVAPAVDSITNNLQPRLSQPQSIEVEPKIDINYSTENCNPVDIYSKVEKAKPVYESTLPPAPPVPQNNNRVGILRRMLNSLFR